MEKDRLFHKPLLKATVKYLVTSTELVYYYPDYIYPTILV